MLGKESVLFWNEIEHDLYEENDHIFGVELDLCNNHQTYYCKKKSYIKEYYYDLGTDIYKALEEFNEMLKEYKKIR